MRVLIALSILLSTLSASAGQVLVHDGAGIMGGADKLRAESGKWPFDLKVLTGSFADRRALDYAVHSCVSSPNVVCVGVDPLHRFVNVHFGAGAGVPSQEYGRISSAGNAAFKRGDWIGGVEAIADWSLLSSRSSFSGRPVFSSTSATTPVQVVQVQQHSDSHWFLWLLLFAGLGGFAYWVVRRVRRQEKIATSLREERDEYLNANVKRMVDEDNAAPARVAPRAPRVIRPVSVAAPVAPPPVTVAPSYAQVPVAAPYVPVPVVVQSPVVASSPVAVRSSGSGDFLNGMLVNEMMHSHRDREVVVEREIVREPSYSSPSYDSGGASSSFSSTSDDSSSSYDSGGASSDFSSSDSDSDFGGGDAGGGGGGGGDF